MSRRRSDDRTALVPLNRRELLAGLAATPMTATVPIAAAAAIELLPVVAYEQGHGLYCDHHLSFVEWEL